jgi:hypothetical protein
MKASEDTAATHFLVLAQSVDFARKMSQDKLLWVVNSGSQGICWYPIGTRVKPSPLAQAEISVLKPTKSVDVVFPAPTNFRASQT